jgi:ribosome-binding protein aMBF1 (putative translation factor)
MQKCEVCGSTRDLMIVGGSMVKCRDCVDELDRKLRAVNDGPNADFGRRMYNAAKWDL